MERYGNEESRALISRLVSHHIDGEKPFFLLVSGAEGLGKKSYLLSYIQDFLGAYFYQDFLWIRDCSQELGKSHTIPVETPATQKTIPLVDGTVYQNRGVREVVSWLQQSAFGGKKVLLIENFERMSNAAMNAFLKTCEEPLPSRFIFATVADESAILPTVFSRAFLVRFSSLKNDEMLSLLSHLSEMNDSFRQMIAKLSAGNPGIAFSLLQKEKENPDFRDFVCGFESDFLSTSSIFLRFDMLKKADEFGILDMMLSFLIQRAADLGDDHQLELWIRVKKMKNANMALDNLLIYGLLS